MSVEFRIGARVVCINGDFSRYLAKYGHHSHFRIHHFPIQGAVYTIRGFDGLIAPPDGMLLEELVNPPLEWAGEKFGEAGFAAPRFRPVRETSIDCFTALLAKPPVRLREDA